MPEYSTNNPNVAHIRTKSNIMPNFGIGRFNSVVPAEAISTGLGGTMAGTNPRTNGLADTSNNLHVP